MAWPTAQEVARPLPVKLDTLDEGRYQGVNTSEIDAMIRVWIERTGWAATDPEPTDSDLARDIVLWGARADALVQIKVYRDEPAADARDQRRQAFELLKRLESGEDVPGGDSGEEADYSGEGEVANFTDYPLWDSEYGPTPRWQPSDYIIDDL